MLTNALTPTAFDKFIVKKLTGRE